MRRIPTLFEIVLTIVLLTAGLHMLYIGGLTKSTNDTAMVMGGAVFATLGVISLGMVLKSAYWHLRMMRVETPEPDASEREDAPPQASHRQLVPRL